MQPPLQPIDLLGLGKAEHLGKFESYLFICLFIFGAHVITPVMISFNMMNCKDKSVAWFVPIHFTCKCSIDLPYCLWCNFTNRTAFRECWNQSSEACRSVIKSVMNPAGFSFLVYFVSETRASTMTDGSFALVCPWFNSHK